MNKNFKIPFILSFLEKKNMDEYAILEAFKKLSENAKNVIVFELDDLKPILKRMEELRYIKSYWTFKELHSKELHRYYKIRSKGRKAFRQFECDRELVNQVFADILDEKKPS